MTDFTEEQALLALDASRRDLFCTLFPAGKMRLTKRKNGLTETANNVGSQTRAFGEAVAKASDAANVVPGPVMDALEMVIKLCGIERDDIEKFQTVMCEDLAMLGIGSLQAVAKEFVPYLSTVYAGATMTKEWVVTAQKYHQYYNLKSGVKSDILPGDAQRAANAVNKLIQRSGRKHLFRASVESAKFAVDVAGTAGGFGAGGAAASAITGAAAAGAKLSQTLYLLGLDYLEMDRANSLLEAGRYVPPEELFGAYPLLGCYLIVSANDSDLLYFMSKDMGQQGFMDKVEKMKKKTLGPLQQTARGEIESSRFKLDGFTGPKFGIPDQPKTTGMAAMVQKRKANMGFGKKIAKKLTLG